MKMYINTMKCLIFIMAFSVSSCEPISPFIIITSDDKPDARSDDTLQDTITYNTPLIITPYRIILGIINQ